MVRILANGDIVPDDDPRTRGRNSSQNNPQGDPYNTAREYAQQYMPQQQRQSVSVFETVNQKLRDLGIPAFTFGDIVVEPVVTVGLLLALIFFGLPGLLIGALLFAVNHWSQHGAPPMIAGLFGGNREANGRGVTRGGRPRGGYGGDGGGGGFRLGN